MIGRDATRCFLALLADAASCEALLCCQEALQTSGWRNVPDIRWVAPDALHLTLRFLGNANPAQVRTLAHALPRLARRLPTLGCDRIALWGRGARRMLVAEVAAEAQLDALAQALEAQARAAGFTAESRTFRAHVTLARLAGNALPAQAPLAAALGALTFDRLALMQSTPGPQGSTYTLLAGAALA